MLFEALLKEESLNKSGIDLNLLLKAKRKGFTDARIAKLTGASEEAVLARQRKIKFSQNTFKWTPVLVSFEFYSLFLFFLLAVAGIRDFL